METNRLLGSSSGVINLLDAVEHFLIISSSILISSSNEPIYGKLFIVLSSLHDRPDLDRYDLLV